MHGEMESWSHESGKGKHRWMVSLPGQISREGCEGGDGGEG
jgi:hypothetical protein